MDNTVVCETCGKNINLNIDTYIRKLGLYFCSAFCRDEKLGYSCKTCKKMLHFCDTCKIQFCSVCEDGSVLLNDDGFYSHYCHKCRDITNDELYLYFKNIYNDCESLDQIRKHILKL